MTEARPIILTCGEPAGVGPELAPKALASGVPFVFLGDPRHLPEGTPWAEVAAPGESVPEGLLAVLRHDFPAPAVPGRPDPANAPAVVEVIARAVDLALSGAAGGICTLPINKEALKRGAGFGFPGHTEYLAHLAGDVPVVMMLASTTVEPPCRVVPVTIHIPLSEVPLALTPLRLEQAIRITDAAMRRDFGLARPRLAIAGLNPHAGENGVMGDEEARWMAPLIERLRREGFDLRGPLPADTMFHPAARARYDAALCAYHDQALIPIKTLDFAGGVNVTLGLPFVRTSPDHGTAFDIAGQGIADAQSVIAALRMAHEMAGRR
ncbi:4-hydroxythreonine-4-phosphate dehydrogenase PdxA [Paracoccus sp. P2]|uniref:4-hydroxythreonine-4-phosphate dehydrogenase n=1 Tax=Paracoccus pantotrophus TaxID=82367 RepID=A0A1I5JXA5_PARPN|nr:4-hydroxythreonine-4-phosphate dehydrogenase PdxA [Paracoccus pantotrophus]MDF3855488.1 4-hydroxythreonine-4-phosphate dehydrogenase PdxA [Paracoccus pantotrophus]QFG37241.1 4-hydroxythreonine-4-phosphate dehydrogenase PdxA [Paracoccus pantotrophus]QLH14802.1 4-hydroxythreonine-4-phosphate dehydrogenase PdxA [Paracoccus pantotrophus]RDD99752.1 4-hydroxythreonine-4-phosphate dehydrogenase PdxA [Paracoccus pantotrophus]RKS52329.1 4-hydroxythreonine-4-phosphate dehydrogenase [Paracoccus pantot